MSSADGPKRGEKPSRRAAEAGFLRDGGKPRVANRRSTTTGCETVAGSAATGSAGSFHQEPRLLQGSYHPLKGLLAGAAQGVEMDAVGEQGQGPGGVFLHLPDKF